MTIRPGQEWGEPGALAEDAPVTDNDRSARAHLQQVLDRLGDEVDRPGAFGELGLLGGDLHRTLGAPAHTAEDLRAGRGTRYPVDLGGAVREQDAQRHVRLGLVLEAGRVPARIRDLHDPQLGVAH